MFKILFIFLLLNLNLFAQVENKDIRPLNKTQEFNVMHLSLGVAAILYLFNPVLAWKDNKLYGGFTKEFSVGWGKLGEHRTSAEYTYIFAGADRHALRFSYKYDILLKEGILPSNSLQFTPALSIGGGYFYDFEKQGVFPEVSYGFSLRNHKLLIYPHVKARYTYMFDKGGRTDFADIFDISAGIVLGIANPFIDMKIRREY